VDGPGIETPGGFDEDIIYNMTTTTAATALARYESKRRNVDRSNVRK